MGITEEEIREIVREALSNMEESDLITKKGSKSWSDHKEEFKNNVDSLLDNIQNDEYEDAEDVIGKTIDILKDWKKRISSGLKSKDSVLDEN
jgi:hypothetical protein